MRRQEYHINKGGDNAVLRSFRILVVVALATMVWISPAEAQSSWQAVWEGEDFVYERNEYVCMDAEHNVYTAGRMVDQLGSEDYLVIKYNSAGVEQWSRTYDGGTGSGFGYDRPGGIGVDAQGNVYVTGRSREYRDPFYLYDFVTIKYDANGTEQWTRRFRSLDDGDDVDDIPHDMHVDSAGNCVVTGESNNTFLTVKYDSAGTELWSARYEPEPGVGVADDVDVDSAGNIYIVGDYQDDNAYTDYVTIKYSPSGVEQWVSKYHVDEPHAFVAEDIAVTSQGVVAVTGYTCVGADPCFENYDITTVKYTTTGSQIWANTYSGPGDGVFMDDFGTGVAIDEAGNVYVTGYSYQQPGHEADFITLKYSPGGTQEWMRLYNEVTAPPTNADSYDRAHDIGVDGFGNVYVTGSCHVEQNVWIEEQLTTLSYDPDGTLRWVDKVDNVPTLPNDPGEGFQLVVDDLGNCAATGYTWGLATFEDPATVFIAGIDALFIDGFESGETTRWSITVN